MVVIGIDLAWGEKCSDGMCTLHASRRGAHVVDFAYPQGDDQLLAALRSRLVGEAEALLAVDAPLVIPNRTGSRPVDRAMHALFHREHAGCYPASAERCPRPARLRTSLRQLGIQTGWDLTASTRLAAEVYPHPALVRFLNLPRIIKYKRGPVAARRGEFRRLQEGLHKALEVFFPILELHEDTRLLLQQPWNKKTEDLTDAFVCALIGLWHWMHHGTRSQVIGTRRSGFILLPEELREMPGGVRRDTRTDPSYRHPVQWSGS
jgi:predicted RNase H-like nuclease